MDEVQELKRQVVDLQVQLRQLLDERRQSSQILNFDFVTQQQNSNGFQDEVQMSATRVIMHHIVLPNMVDKQGACFGGQVLSWVDICAGLAAKTLAKGPCVTASVDEIHFIKPCRLGMIVIVASRVNRSFRTSMEIQVEVEGEDAESGDRFHCCTALLTFVAVEGLQKILKDGRLPQIMAQTQEEMLIFEAACKRREVRLSKKSCQSKDEDIYYLPPITHRQGSPSLPPALRLQDCGSDPKVERPVVSPGVTIAYMTQAIHPHHANTLGITFGGQVMAWMEQCSYIAASRLRGGNLMTANMDSIAFKKATRVGDVLYITAQVTAVFGSSLEVLISVFGEDLYKGDLFHCANAFATLVAIGADGTPRRFPFDLSPSTEAEIQRYNGAIKRREERLLMRRQLMDSRDHSKQKPDISGLFKVDSQSILVSMAND